MSNTNLPIMLRRRLIKKEDYDHLVENNDPRVLSKEIEWTVEETDEQGNVIRIIQYHQGVPVNIDTSGSGTSFLADDGKYKPANEVLGANSAIDETTVHINLGLKKNDDITYLADDVRTVNITLDDWVHGHVATVNFKAISGYFRSINIHNNSDLPLKILKHDKEVDNILHTKPEAVFNLMFHCDGFYIYCYFTEVGI